MTIEKFSKYMMILGTTYNKEIKQDQIKIWYEFLNDIDEETFGKAIKQIIQRSKFFPTVADIREEAAYIEGGETLSLIPEEEWKKVLYCIRHYGPYKTNEIKEYLGKQTYEITTRFGWEDLFNLETENTSYIGDRYIKFYQANQKNYKEQLQIGNVDEVQKLKNEMKALFHKVD